MGKKLCLVLLTVWLLGLASDVDAVMWSGAVSRDWSDDGNWQGIGGEPDPPTDPCGSDATSVVIFDQPTNPLPNLPLITEPNEHTAGRFFLNAPLEMTSGELTCWSRFYIGYERRGPGEFTMRGGVVNILDYFPDGVDPGPGRLSVADESTGIFNMYDGQINVSLPDGTGGIKFPDGSGQGTINLFGGVIHTSRVEWKSDKDCQLIFQSSEGYPHGGKLIVNGDVTYPDPNHGVTSGSIYQAYVEGLIITAIPRDVVSIKYEPVEDVTIVESVPTPPGDINGDGVVDWDDLAILVEQWLDRCRIGEWCGGCDLNESGRVDFDDFAIFASDWFESWP